MNDQDKALVDQLRAWQPLVSNGHEVPGAGNSMYEAANRIEDRAAEIELLREAGTKLAGYAGHDDNCEIMLKGVWSDPIPCTCGYEDAWKAWAALGEGND
jgi:hypothetical protein